MLHCLFISERVNNITSNFTTNVIHIDNFKFKTDFFVVAVTNNTLSLGEYNCLLNSDIFERGTKINEDKVFK